MNSETKKAARLAYKQQVTEYGVIQIENTRTHQRFIAAVPNIKNRWVYYQLNLNRGAYHNQPLQRAWDADGAEAFEYSVLFKKDAAKVVNMRATLKDLLAEWTERVHPEY